MFTFQPIDYRDKARFYAELEGEISGLMERAWFTNLANAAAALMAHLPELNWAGFYLAQGEELVLGPFQGLPACLRIPFGRGVCGTAAARRETVRVDDVEAFPGHIACDSRSRSEIVVPLVRKGSTDTMVQQGRLCAVLDLDSPQLSRFDEMDRQGLERIASVIVTASEWPDSFF